MNKSQAYRELLAMFRQAYGNAQILCLGDIDSTGLTLTILGTNEKITFEFFTAANSATLSELNSLKHTQNTDTALGTQSEDLDMGTHKIVNVVDPVNAQDAVTKKYFEDNSGSITVVANAAARAALEAEQGDMVLEQDTKRTYIRT